jgi:hypothetical protein
MAKVYKLEKEIWTEDDFEIMSWHDNTIHAISFSKNDELLLDIDYIFEWVHPKDGKGYFKFWIAPCTLVFENIYQLKLDLEISAVHHRKIDNISMEDSQRAKSAANVEQMIKYDWVIETLQGEITFEASGYKQYVRKQPLLMNNDELDMETRGGVSFNLGIN